MVVKSTPYSGCSVYADLHLLERIAAVVAQQLNEVDFTVCTAAHLLQLLIPRTMVFDLH